MELFIPGLIVLVLSAVFAFFIIPRTGSMILAIACLIAIILAGIHHYSTFYAEYQLSTWQNGLRDNAIFVILGLAILAIIGAIFYMFSGGSKAIEETPMETLQNAVMNVAANIPPASTATNPITAAVNSGIQTATGALNAAVTGATNAVTGAITGATGAITGAVNAAKNAVVGAPTNMNRNKKPSPVIPGLNFRASEI